MDNNILKLESCRRRYAIAKVPWARTFDTFQGPYIVMLISDFTVSDKVTLKTISSATETS